MFVLLLVVIFFRLFIVVMIFVVILWVLLMSFRSIFKRFIVVVELFGVCCFFGSFGSWDFGIFSVCLMVFKILLVFCECLNLCGMVCKCLRVFVVVGCCVVSL